MKHALLTSLAVVIIAAYFLSKKERWEGFVYPDKDNLLSHVNIGVFESLEECRDAADAEMRRLSSPEIATYECGLNCEVKPGWTAKVCDDTQQ